MLKLSWPNPSEHSNKAYKVFANILHQRLVYAEEIMGNTKPVSSDNGAVFRYPTDLCLMQGV